MAEPAHALRRTKRHTHTLRHTKREQLKQTSHANFNTKPRSRVVSSRAKASRPQPLGCGSLLLSQCDCSQPPSTQTRKRSAVRGVFNHFRDKQAATYREPRAKRGSLAAYSSLKVRTEQRRTAASSTFGGTTRGVLEPGRKNTRSQSQQTPSTDKCRRNDAELEELSRAPRGSTPTQT